MLLLLVSACAPMAEIDLEVMDPADFTLPVNVLQLAFLNRTKSSQILGDTAKWPLKETSQVNKVLGQSIFKGVRKAMVSSPLYSMDTIKVINYSRFLGGYITEPLSSKELDYLNNIHPADALISLEICSIHDTNDDKENKPLYNSIYIRLDTKTLWRIYDMNQGSILDEYTLNDTFAMEFYKSTYAESKKGKLRMMIRAVDAAAYQTGLMYGNRISPAWIQVPRYYYKSGGKDMRKAAKKAAKDDWDGAADIWKKLAYQEDTVIAARASFNMALVCEMEDLMIPALDWATKSSTLMPDTLTNEYIRLLKKRSEQLDDLEKQVPDPKL